MRLGDEPIIWAYLVVDKTGPCAWVLGVAENWARLYVARVGYEEALQGGSASVRLYYAEDPDVVWKYYSIVCLPGGRLACVGGGWDNYNPSGQAMILHAEPSRHLSVIWLIPAVCLLAAAAAVVFWRIRHHRNKVLSDPVPDASAPTKEDLTRVVSSNSRYVSDSINAVAGCSFIDYVNNYRIRYAQRLLYEKPDMSLSEISEESGFSSEVTFYRNFKARTGQTPGEWLAARNRS